METGIKSWAKNDRPREKMILNGRSALSDAELLSILLGSGSREKSALDLARELLKSVGNDINALARMESAELCRLKGIGQAKAVSIMAAMEIGLRRHLNPPQEPERVSTSQDIFKLMRPFLGDLRHEEFWVMHLNNNNALLERQQLSKGGWSATVADQRMVFKKCYELGTHALVLCHNHPSGVLRASVEDRQLTERFKAAAQLLDFKLLDHVIITQNNYFSLLDNHLM